jgi:molybdopterin converting factor small subunit
MDVVEIFGQFRKDVFPDEEVEVKISEVVLEFESFLPEIVKIIQKDVTFFDEERLVFGRNISKVDNREAVWKNLVPCMIASFMHGDIRKKVGKISEIIKNVWNASGQENDAVTSILNDEKSEGRFQEILDFIMNSRLVKIFTNFMKTVDISDFELNFDNPAELIELLKDPENPKIKGVINKIQGIIKDKVRKGEIDQKVIVSEVEAIKAKIMGLFGNIFNDALGGRKADVPSAVLNGNSPEARRQRMLARLRRKLDEKNSK